MEPVITATLLAGLGQGLVKVFDWDLICCLCYNASRTTAMRDGFVERKGKLSELDRSFDLQFWQAQPAQARFNASWELVLHAWRVKGHDVRQLRLQRSVETFQRQPR